MINTYVLTYYKDEEPIVLQTKLDSDEVEFIIDQRSELQDDENYELCGEADSEIILHECKKLDENAKYLDAEVLTY